VVEIITSKFNKPGQSTKVKQITKINTEITVAGVVIRKDNVNYLFNIYVRARVVLFGQLE